MSPVFTNDAVVLGLLTVVLALIMWTSRSNRPFWQRFYKFVPALLLCYFIPALLNWPLGWVSGEESQLYFMASRYLLPASLILLCVSIDFKAIFNLGPKALIMFLTGTLGVILGGPVALLVITNFFPSLLNVPPDELWRGLSTVAGSWIGGGANQTAMKEIFEVSDNLFGSMLVVDIIVANIWMGFLLYGASINKRIDSWLKADSSAIEQLKQRVEDYRTSIAKMPSTYSLFLIAAVAFGGTGLAHLGADLIMPALQLYESGLKEMGMHSLISDFFWVVVLATTIGLVLSFTKARQLDGVGASQWGTLFIYVLVATIGMKMNLQEVFSHLGLFAIGLIWMLIHAVIMILVAKWIKAPFFFLAVGSQANIGGAASAPVVASAFSPSLAPVGVLLAVLGYALGTYGALICAWLMQAVI
ncbi:MAG: DUF819 family protein [Saprospiraceae bacterium]|nr:DUF819 family protein [Saprospiraceae bacterium]